MGPAIADGGVPYARTKHVTRDGAGSGPLGDMPSTGCTIVDMPSLQAATQACADHPHAKHSGQVKVFNCIHMSDG